MSRSRSRALIGAITSATVILLIVLVVGIASGPKTPSLPAPPSVEAATVVSGAASPTTMTTTPAATVTKPTPTPPSPPRPAAAPTAVATKPFIPRQLGNAGALLVPPPKPDVRTETSLDCSTLADPDWASVECRSGPVGNATFTYLSEFRDIGAYVAGRAYVFRQRADGRHEVVLQAIDDRGALFLEYQIAAVFESVEGGGVGDLVVGFQVVGKRLELDVVGGSGVVTLHQVLGQGAAWPSPGQLDTWGSSTVDTWTHDTIVWGNGGWRIVGEELVTTSAVPQTAFN